MIGFVSAQVCLPADARAHFTHMWSTRPWLNEEDRFERVKAALEETDADLIYVDEPGLLSAWALIQAVVAEMDPWKAVRDCFRLCAGRPGGVLSFARFLDFLELPDCFRVSCLFADAACAVPVLALSFHMSSFSAALAFLLS